VYRYDRKHAPDGIQGDEGTFNICTFWLVEALVKSAGRTSPAGCVTRASSSSRCWATRTTVGLYSEETGPTGEHLGNFPQAFTHLGLISAAFNLDRVLGGPQSSR
jgi:GH15 family glucan-1,4-alpha-glucosidase